MSARIRTAIFALAIVLSSSIVGVAAMEALVRWKFPQPTGLSHQDRFGLPLHWPSIVRYLPQFGHEVSFNSVGMRDREHQVAKRPGDFRILLTGDSFMEAYQVPFDSSMPPRLERALTAPGAAPVEVINAGVSGWGTDDELRYYTEYARAYKPDLVVVAMTLHNDISDNLRRMWHTERDGKLVDRDPAPIPRWDYLKLSVKANVSTRFQLYQLWRRVRHGGEMRVAATQLRSHVATLFDEPLTEQNARGVLLTELLLARMDSAVRGDGGKLVVVLLPLNLQISDSAFAQFAAASGANPASLRLDRPQSLIAEAAARHGIPVIDLLPGFREWIARGSGPLFMETDGHWNAQGHRLATELVAGALRDRGLVP